MVLLLIWFILFDIFAPHLLISLTPYYGWFIHLLDYCEYFKLMYIFVPCATILRLQIHTSVVNDDDNIFNMSVKEKGKGCIFYYYYCQGGGGLRQKSLEILTSWHLVLCCFKLFCATGLIYIILFIWCSTYANVVYCKFIFNLSGGFFVEACWFFYACKPGFL